MTVGLDALDLAAILAATTGAIAVFNRIAARFGMLDAPDGIRKTHARPTPLTGGVSLLVGAWIGALLALNALDIDLKILSLLGVVVAIHALDDHSGLSARQRLAVDAMIAIAFTMVTGTAIQSLGVAFGFPIPLGFLAVPITVFAYLALTNAFNMLDGVDGIALSQFLISMAALCIWRFDQTPEAGLDGLGVAIVAASLPVLAANLGLLGRRMKCFLGDSGSRFLGFFLTYTLIAEAELALSPIYGAYFVALPLLDMAAVIIDRLRAGESPLRPDRRHLHHFLIDGLGSRRLTLAIMASASLGFIALVWALNAWGAGDAPAAALLLTISALYWRFRRRLVAALARLLARRRASAAGAAE